MTSANPVHRELAPKMSAAFHSATPSGCKLLTKASLPLEVQTEAGAPTEVVVEVTVDGSSFEWTVVQVDKRRKSFCTVKETKVRQLTVCQNIVTFLKSRSSSV